ncbi:MucBP domain-containing protein, partial [Paenibacillus sp. GCM10027629]|uniref:MucBP domain-containing protein n=1 Tax=Paenibacillus sp. GCM10027629 TaxID=3273414 RepID=UPI003638F80E
MRRGFRLVVTWMFILSVFTGFIPGTLPVSSAAASNDLVWPNPGAVNLTKKAEPTGTPGEWKVTLTVEGKNIKSSSDVVLVIDRSGSMKGTRMSKAIESAQKFVDRLLYKDSTTRIAAVSFAGDVTDVSDFKNAGQIDALKKAIGNISPSGGTNIQGGIHRADELLKSSKADNKVIVLLSDGEPTYSYKASNALDYTWPGDKTKSFALSNFDYTYTIGSGGSYDLDSGWTDYSYKIGKYKVTDNGKGTISEAKLAMDKGIQMYSIGLEVGDNTNATNVLKYSQNRGYYASNSSELEKVFAELSSKISYAAQNAKVIDPMGGMFDKTKGPEVSQGTIKWNDTTETITWEIGNIVEGSPATMTYIVKLDSTKNPDPNTLYPTNGKTYMEYTDVNNKPASKDFEVPKVSFGKGSIMVKGYRVNAEGTPVNEENKPVDRPDLAAPLYSESFKQNGNEALDINKKYTVTAKIVEGYLLKKGASPQDVTLTYGEPNPTIWFGYAKAPYNIKIEYKVGNIELEKAEDVKKLQGESIDIQSKSFEGYTLKDVSVSAGSGLEVKGGQVTGTMPNKDVTVTFNYEAIAQSVKVKYLLEGTDKEVAPSITVPGTTNATTTLKAANVAGYTVVGESTKEYKFTAEKNQEVVFYFKAAAQKVTVKYLEKGTNKELAKPEVEEGVTGKTIKLDAKEVAGYKAEQATIDYTFTNGTQEAIFYYTASAQKVTVKYLEKGTNKELAKPEVEEGVTGKTIKLDAKEVAGYKAEQATIDYTFINGTQEAIFYYTAAEQKVTVKYLEKGTNKELAKPEVEEGVTGKTVKLEAKEVAGYTPEQATIDYTFTNGTQEAIFYYTASAQKVTVKYLEKGTNKELAKP